MQRQLKNRVVPNPMMLKRDLSPLDLSRFHVTLPELRRSFIVKSAGFIDLKGASRLIHTIPAS